MRRLGQRHPHPVRRYERLCTEGAYAPQWYQRRITRYVHEPATEFGIGPSHHGSARRLPLRHGRWSPLDGSEPARPTLFRPCGCDISGSGTRRIPRGQMGQLSSEQVFRA